MKHHTGTRIATVAVPLVLGMAHAALAGAQVRTVIRDTTLTRPAAMPMAAGAPKMMAGPHQALAMAYGESLAAFARAMNADASQSQTVKVELARPATLEMRRSFDQMKLHHTAQMATGGMAMRMPMTADSAAGMTRPTRRDSMTKPLPPGSRRDSVRKMPMPPPTRPDSTMGHSMPMPMSSDSARMTDLGEVQAHMATIETHLGMLETEVKSPAPNTAKVIEHTAEILKSCAAAMRMPSDPMGARRTP